MHENNNKQHKPIIDEKDWHTPGIMLRKARRDKGLSEAEVCSQLGLTSRSLRALESDNLSRLPAATYVRGYIRRYCDLLGISAEQVVASYETLRDEEEGEPVPEVVVEPPKPPVWQKPALWGVVVFVVVVLVFWLLRGTSASIEASEYHTSVAEQYALMPTANNNPQVLSLVFHGNSWVEVVDARHDILLADLKKAGDRLELRGEPPFELRIGRPENVEIHHADRLVNVKSTTQTRIAKVVIGN